jgi:N-acetylmuramoyl-L-alanine amidase
MKKLLFAASILLSLPSFAQQKTLIIDAAHGGADNGAIGATGISESYVTWMFAEALRKSAIEAGYTVVLTRPEPGTLPSLEERAALIRKYPGNTRFISLHAGTATNTAVRGAVIRFDGGNGASNGSGAWAESLKTALAAKAAKIEVSNSTKLRVLTGSPVPAVSIDLGYMSNLEDLVQLETPSYQEAVAKLIVSTLE